MKIRLKFATCVLASLGLVGCREPNAPAAATPADAETNSATSKQAPSQSTTAQPVAATAADAGQLKTGTLCNVELADGQLFGSGAAPATPDTTIRGWLGDDSGTVPTAPMLVVQADSANTAASIPIALNIKREDVVKAFPSKSGLESSGFEASLAPASLKAGRYHLYLVYSIGTESRLCDNGRYITVITG